MTLKDFKTKMIAKARKYGFKENFGQAEIAKLKEKYKYDAYAKTDEALSVKQQIEWLESWVSNLDLNDLN